MGNVTTEDTEFHGMEAIFRIWTTRCSGTEDTEFYGMEAIER